MIPMPFRSCAMYNKKIFIWFAIGLLASAAAILILHLWGIPLREVVIGIVFYTLMGLLAIFFSLRFALIFVGVFAIYRILLERKRNQLAA
jgi:hypothetical protein